MLLLAPAALATELVKPPEADERVQVFVTWHRGWTNYGDGYCKNNEVDCYGEVEGAQTSVASNDKTPEWYETVVFERSCSDYRDVTFSMIDSDANDKKGGDDDLVVECRFTLADFVHMRFTKPDAGLPDHMEEERWALGESVKSKGCLAKQCVYTCMGQPADESSGFQFALAGMRFTSENGCGDQPFMPGDNYDLDKFHAYRNQSYKDGGAIAWPEPSTLTPVEPTELELASVFDFASPRAFAAYDVGDVVPIAWRHDGAVSEETVEIYAVPVPDAMPKVGTAPSPRDLQREYEDAGQIHVVAWHAKVGRGGVPGGWTVPDTMKTGTYRFRAYPANMYPAWSAAFHVTAAPDDDDAGWAKLGDVRVFCAAALLAVVAATITVAGAAKMRKRRLPRATVLDAQVALVVPRAPLADAKAAAAGPPPVYSEAPALPASPAVEVKDTADDVIHIDVTDKAGGAPAAAPALLALPPADAPPARPAAGELLALPAPPPPETAVAETAPTEFL